MSARMPVTSCEQRYCVVMIVELSGVFERYSNSRLKKSSMRVCWRTEPEHAQRCFVSKVKHDFPPAEKCLSCLTEKAHFYLHVNSNRCQNTRFLSMLLEQASCFMHLTSICLCMYLSMAGATLLQHFGYF